jgi:hypothetical protein
MKALSSVFLAGLLAACGGGGSGGGGATCQSASELLCARACECGAPMCKFGDGAGSTVTFDSEGDCIAFLNLGCSMAAGVDFEVCEADAEAAACVGTGANMAFASPASCDTD